MSVIVEVTIPSEAFQLGRIFRLEGVTQLTLETLVPLGGTPTPFVRVRNEARETLERSVRDHPAVNKLILVNTHANEVLYTLDWEVSGDSLFQRILDLDAVLLDATGAADTWELKLRFPTHNALSAFQEYYAAESITVSIERVYVPTRR